MNRKSNSRKNSNDNKEGGRGRGSRKETSERREGGKRSSFKDFRNARSAKRKAKAANPLVTSAKKVYYLFHKPYGVLCQYTKEVDTHITLADYLNLPADVYPVGRLDKDSEGLLLLTNDNHLKTVLLDPKSRSPKTYWVQVDGNIDVKAVDKLRKGVDIKHNGAIHHTLPAVANKIPEPQVEERNPPVRYRANIPTSWIEITIIEGKNRQIRKMCSAVGFPVLRLVRCKIKNQSIKGLSQGEYKEVSKADFR